MNSTARHLSTALFALFVARPASAQVAPVEPPADASTVRADAAQPAADQTAAGRTADASLRPAQNASDAGGVGDIIVTAQRRSESAQTVPVSVAAFDAQRLAASSAASTTDLPLLVPGVTLQRGGGGSESIFIRGVGNGGTVLKYVDGVLQVFGGVPTVFNNLASVEVDKGPQSTLFGRNATGGVVQFRTKTPSDKPGLDVSLGYANYNTFTGSLYATTGLAPNLKTDLSLYYNKQVDGWGKNLATGNDVYTGLDFAVRSKTVWQPTDRFTAALTLDYQYTRTAVGNAIAPAKNIPFLYNYLTGTRFTVPGRYNVNTDYDPFGISRRGVVALRLEDDLGPFRVASITSYQRSHAFLHLDYDGTTTPFFNINRDDYGRAWTQELQLLSQPQARIQWVVGFYYLNIRSQLKPFAFRGVGAAAVFGAPAGQDFNIYANTGLASYAGFGQATIPIFANTKITLGARYTIDNPSIDGYTAKGNAIVANSAGGTSTTFRRPTFRADVQQKLATSVFGYVSYNRGYNTGGYNNVAPGGFAGTISRVDPETIDAYEAGIKSQFANNLIRLNGAVFLYNYTNLQQQIYQSGGLATVNAAAARIKGIDLDTEIRPVRNLVLTAGLGLLDSKFTDYRNAPIYTIAATGALISTPGDATGRTTVSAPKVGFNATARYTLDTGIGAFASNVAVTYSSRWYADASNNFYEPRHTLVNLSETWTTRDQRTSVTGYVKNLGNVFYDAGINLLTPVGAFSEPGAPRTYGISVSRHF